jgi:RNA polymerase-binding protein DksA
MSELDEHEIRARLERRRADLEELERSIQEDATSTDGAGANLSSARQHPADLATDVFEHSKELSILSTIARSLADVGFALDRLTRGSYGRCEACGADIGAARLEARPEARYCIDDQTLAERSA